MVLHPERLQFSEYIVNHDSRLEIQLSTVLGKSKEIIVMINLGCACVLTNCAYRIHYTWSLSYFISLDTLVNMVVNHVQR